MIKINKESISKVLDLDVEDVEKLYRINVGVDFIRYEGTIKRKYLESIVRKCDNSDIDLNTFGKELSKLCGYNECKSISITMEYYAHWNNDGDIEWHDTLNKGVKSIKLYIKL